MAQSKNKTNLFMQCEKCLVVISKNSTNNHSNDCPPNLNNISYGIIKDKVLYSTLDIKSNEDIKGLSSKDKENLVFLSQNVIQLCGFSIGDYVLLNPLNNTDIQPIAKKVWPTSEKSVTSVLLTKACFDLSFTGAGIAVNVSALPNNTPASQIVVILLNASKSLEVTSELNTRISKTFIGHYLTVGNIISVWYYGKSLKLEVKSIHAGKSQEEINVEHDFSNLTINGTPRFFAVSETTKWNIYQNNDSYSKELRQVQQYIVAGIDNEANEIRELMHSCLNPTNEKAQNLCRAVLLYGHSGTGKTTLAQALAQESKTNTIMICAADLFSKNTSSVECTIRELFESAIEQTPSVLILDEIDILCPSRNNRLTDTEKRIVSTVIVMIDELSQLSDSKVFIIATTNKLDNIDQGLRRCGRLDREIEIPTPNPNGRLAILKKLLGNCNTALTDEEYKEVAQNTHGFVGADLVSLCSQSQLYANKRDGKILLEDFKLSLRKVRPSAMREVQIEVPNIKWNDIGGQDNLKLILRQAVEWPLKYAESFLRLGVTPPRGVLMFGPPGCSKTMIAKALANESGLNFLSIKGPELFSKWVGESEKAVREVFRKARQVAPSVVFFDEIDALGGERSSGSSTSVHERVLAQLLTELDGVTPLGDVTILAATNRPDKIDKALLRPGRLDRIVYVPLPDGNTRREIFRIKFNKMPIKDVCMEDLIKKTEGYSGAEVNAVCQEAAMMALEESLDIEQVEIRHFEKALKLITPRTPQSLIQLYEDYVNIKI